MQSLINQAIEQVELTTRTQLWQTICPTTLQVHTTLVRAAEITNRCSSSLILFHHNLTSWCLSSLTVSKSNHTASIASSLRIRTLCSHPLKFTKMATTMNTRRARLTPGLSTSFKSLSILRKFRHNLSLPTRWSSILPKVSLSQWRTQRRAVTMTTWAVVVASLELKLAG